MKSLTRRVVDFFDNSEKIILLIILSLFSLLRIPSLIEPYWYGDEGIYQVIGKALNSGRILYKEIWDNKPPLLYFIYALFNGDQFLVRLFSLFFGLCAVVSFYFLAKKLFGKKNIVIGTTILFALLFGLPVLEGNIANSENFMLFPIISAMYLIYNIKKTNINSHFIFAGLLLSFAFLLKIVAIFDFVAAITIITILTFFDSNIDTIKGILSVRVIKKSIFLFKKELLVFGASFVFPIIITILYFVSVGAFADFYKAAFSQNVGYVAYGNRFLVSNGLLYLKFIFLIFSILFIVKYRKSLDKAGVFIFTWTAFSLFNAFFSERPYTHYLLVLLAPLCLLAGFIFSEKKLSKITSILFIAIIFFVWTNFNIYKKIVPYYMNFISFSFGDKTVEKYRAFFDKRNPQDYELANFILSKTNKEDNIFIWGNSGQIYALSDKLPPGRYIVAYHIDFYKNALSETQKAIDNAKPKYMISLNEDANFSYLLPYYTLRYKIGDVKIYER